VVDLLARGLAARGHDVLLWTTGDATCPVPRAWFHATPPPMQDPVSEAAHALAGYDALHDVDVVHDHTTLGPLLAPAGAWPLVATSHGPFTDAAKRLYATAARRAHVVAISGAQAASAQPEVPIAAVILHGIDTGRVPVGAGDGGYVAFLGRMAPEKGVHVAIEAAQRAGVPLRIAAKCREPLEQEYFDAAVRPWLGPGVEFLGEVGEADKHALLGGALALVNPIAWPEPYGLVMAEALACGTPVIARPHGAAPELVRDGVTGFVCDDVEAVAAAIGAAATLSRAACRHDAEVRLSADRMVADHEALYGALVGVPVSTPAGVAAEGSDAVAGDWPDALDVAPA
jgi:glycosyltransferase involved in cell wall biosynthesis